MRSLVIGIASALFITYSGIAEASVPPPTKVDNLMLAVSLPPEAAGDLVVFGVSEAGSAATDLNGDGDTLDVVVHVRDVVAGTTTNLGLAGSFDVGDDLVVLHVKEWEQGIDLNGDGDLFDYNVRIYDHVNGAITDTGTFSSPLAVLTSKRRVFIGVSELQQGVDLNGDGDSFDSVMHVFDVPTGTLANLSLAVDHFDADGDLLVVAVSESGQGLDLDGDGDSLDWVIHAVDLTTNTITNLGLAGQLADQAHRGIDGGLAAFKVIEGQTGVDRNGDGDAADAVLHVYDAATGIVVNTGLAIFDFSIDGARIACRVSENGQGVIDLNGDGDASDSVMHVFDTIAGLATNLGLHTTPLWFKNGLLAGAVRETSQGTTDLNGDGDVTDSIAFVHDASSGATTLLGVAIHPVSTSMIVGAGTAALLVSEYRQKKDLNGDGDDDDLVLHIYTASTGELRTTGLAGSSLVMSDAVIGFRVSEFGQGGADLNGDGDTSDSVAHVHDPMTGTTDNLGLATSSLVSLDGGALAFVTAEPLQGLDLNGDGDLGDDVLHVARNLPSNCGALSTYGAGCPGPTASTPALVLNGCAAAGCPVAMSITDGPPSSAAWLVFGVGPAALPIGGGCTLNVTPLLPVFVGPLPLDVEGNVTLAATLPVAPSGTTLTMQAFFPIGVGLAASNGAELTTP